MSMKISNTQSTACRTITIGFLLALCSLQLNAVEEVIFSDDFKGVILLCLRSIPLTLHGTPTFSP